MLGATNYWLDKNGKAHMVYHSHAEFAEKTTGIKFSRDLTPGREGNRAWALQGQAYETMYRKGWIRVSLFGPEKRIQIEFRGSISRPAMEWLQDEAFARKAVVVDDHGRIYADFRSDTNESVAYRIVNRLLENVDAKDFALSTDPVNPEGMVVWLSLSDEEVPVGFDAHGFFFYDAAYTLGGMVSEEDYDRITSAIIDGLNQGKEEGTVASTSWVYRPSRYPMP